MASCKMTFFSQAAVFRAGLYNPYLFSDLEQAEIMSLGLR